MSFFEDIGMGTGAAAKAADAEVMRQYQQEKQINDATGSPTPPFEVWMQMRQQPQQPNPQTNQPPSAGAGLDPRMLGAALRG